jgi:hypothetical protein
VTKTVSFLGGTKLRMGMKDSYNNRLEQDSLWRERVLFTIENVDRAHFLLPQKRNSFYHLFSLDCIIGDDEKI